MNCLDCGRVNDLQQRNCEECGASLAPVRASFYLDIAEADINKGDYDAASHSLVNADQEMISISPEQRDQLLLRARAFWLQGLIYYNKGNIERAEEELRAARLALEGNPTGKMLLAEVLNRLGNVSYYHGLISDALSYYESSHELAIQEGAHAVATKAINNQGNVYFLRGDVDMAVVCYNQGLKEAQQAGPVALAQAYSVLTWLHSSYGPFSLALEYAAKGIALCQDIDNLSVRGYVLTQAGAAYLKHGDLEQAEQCLHQAYDLARRIHNRIGEEEALAELVELAQQKDDHEAWLNYALASFKATANSHYRRKESALQLLVYYINQHDWSRAGRTMQTLRRQARQGDDHEAALVNQAEARLQAALGNWDSAERCFRLALDSGKLTRYEQAIVWEAYAHMLLQRADTQSVTSDMVEAEQGLRRAAVLFRQLELDRRADAAEVRLRGLQIAAL